ncbi:MAG TPA: serine/threonine-protein kinase [Myxococcota bacterium]|nr:serine/threonine-protein kinase [Myxococcota bacterium]
MSTRAMPQRFGKYILLRRIAVGGMAEIFKAKVAGREGFEKDLVIKRILSHFNEDPNFVKMFVDEARLTAKLAHPNIVQIFDFDVQDGQYYIAMEYIEGKDLKDVLVAADEQGEPLSVTQVVFIALEVAKGLHHAHTKEDKGQLLNIVHRDVTPSNVMISYGGDVKLMDFGIAKATERSSKTQAGAVKGKVAYMAPEQARAKHVDGRTDLFALGVVMWEMLTGRSLFLAEADYETLVNVLKMEVAPPSSINPKVPSDLDAIVLKCLEKEADDRFPTAEALAGELTRFYYANVVDHERDKLKPLMTKLFKHDIGRLEKESLEDEALMSGATGVGPAPEALAAVASTVAGSVEMPTRMDLAERAVTHARKAVVEEPKKRSPLLWILLVLLLGGGGAAAFLLTQNKGSGEPVAAPVTAPTTAPTPPVEEATATLYLKIEPHTATVTVDGKPAGGEVKDLALGSKVRVVAEAPGYKRFEELVAIEERAPVFAVKMVRDGVPHRFIIKPPGDGDAVYVDDQKLGVGAQPYEGLIGQRVSVRIEPADGGAHVVRSIEVDPEQSQFAIQLPAELTIALSPPEAKVTASAGEVVASSAGEVKVTGLETGASVTVKATAPGRAPFEKALTLGKRAESLKIELAAVEKPADKPVDKPADKPSDKPPEPLPYKPVDRPVDKPVDRPPDKPVAVGKGAISIDARPWAQVMVNGRPYGQTPRVVKDLEAGSHTVVLTRGAQKVTRSVKVQAGKQASVFVDFTEL